MQSKTKTISHILRWLFFIPLAVVIYAVTKFCLAWTFSFISVSTVRDIGRTEDFGGHIILGPIFVFLFEAFAVGFGVYCGLYLCPKFKKPIFWALCTIWIVGLLVASFFIGLTFIHTEWTTGKIIRNVTEIVGQLFGLVGAGIYIWKEERYLRERYAE